MGPLIKEGGGHIVFDSPIRLGLQAVYPTRKMPCPQVSINLKPATEFTPTDLICTC